MSTIVVYSSKNGSTARYAQWIADEIGAPCLPWHEASRSSIDAYDTIVYGGGVYAGTINGLSRLVRIAECAKVTVFATGTAAVTDDTVRALQKRNLTRRGITNRLFYFPGAFDFQALRGFDRFVMSMLRRVLRSKKDRSSDEQKLLESYETPVDRVERGAIGPLIAYLHDGE